MMPSYDLYHGDCLKEMERLPSNSIDLIATDPPYFRVKGEYWDRQWDNPAGFIEWIGKLCEQWRRILKPNGSLYVFASPQMSARVEVKVSEYFNVLNNIRWVKEAGWHNKTDEEILRSYLSPWESIIFAEQWWSDDTAEDGVGYYSQCKALHKDVYSPIGRYIQTERERAGVTRNQVEVALGYVSSSDPARGTALCYRWEEGSSLPTRETYDRLRDYLNSANGHNDYLRRDYEDLRRDYEDLRRDYEDLRRDYEDLRRDYEDLRRPFNVTDSVPYSDVWNFPTVQSYEGKHPCEKPVAMIEHIINASSKPGATVLDCFFGSGNTGVACLKTGRRFIGIELDSGYFKKGQRRLKNVSCELRGEWKPLNGNGHKSLADLPLFAMAE